MSTAVAAPRGRPSRKEFKRVRNETAEKAASKENEVRIVASRGQRMYIKYAIDILTGAEGKQKHDTVILSGMGNAVYNVVNIAEIVKRRVKGLHQITTIGSQTLTDKYEAVEAGKDGLTVERKVSVIEITLSTTQLDTKNIGYQAPLPESEVTEQDERVNERRERPAGEGRGRGGRRGGRGGRGGRREGNRSDEKPAGEGRGRGGRGRGADRASARGGRGRDDQGQRKGKKENPKVLALDAMLKNLPKMNLVAFRLSGPSAEQSKTIRDWAKAILSSDVFDEQAKEAVQLLQQKFFRVEHFGSSVNPNLATKDSDVDVMVLASSDETDASMKLRLSKLKHFRLGDQQKAVKLMDFKGAKLFHFQYKNCQGEVIWVTDEKIFDSEKEKIRNDPLLNLTDIECDALVALKRLKREVFGGLYPKSRVLHHVVHAAYKKLTPPPLAPSNTVDLSMLLAEALRQWVGLTEKNYPSYNRYLEEEWVGMRKVIRQVMKRWGVEH